MKNYFPAQRQSYTYLQTNRSDSVGSIWATMGTDFQSDLNTLRVAPRMLVGAKTADVANLGLPVAFQYWDNGLWTIAGSRVFNNYSAPNTAWTVDSSTGAATNYNTTGDLAVFNGLLWSASATDLYSKVPNGGGTGAWTSRDSSLTATDHPMVYFPVFNRLYYHRSAGLIASINTANTVSTTDYALALGTANPASCMEVNSTSIWIGVSSTTNQQNGVAQVYQWDGISAVASKAYPLQAQYVEAMCVFEDIPYVMDGNGILSKYTGYSFKEVGRIPFNPLQPRTDFIQRNGLIPTRNRTILAMIYNGNSGSTTTQYETIPSGVWEWSENFGFTHKYAMSYTPSGTSTITDYGQNILSLPGAMLDVSAVSPSTSGRNGTILVGADYFTDASTTTHGIFFDDSLNTIQKKGYAVTTWFFSAEIQDKWTRLWTVFRRLQGATDSLVFKYRITEENPLYATITWVNTTSFTTSTDPSAYWTSNTGGEVEVLQGTGSGCCAHITNIVNNAGTYTVTLDETITGVTNGTAKVRFQKWVKVFPAVTGTSKVWEQMNVGASHPRTQIKCCFTFTGDGEFYKFALFSNEDITVNA